MSESVQVLDRVVPPVTSSDRLIARYGHSDRGPLLISIGGLHGNEPAGVHAIRRVHGALRKKNAQLQGEWLALAGNLAALEVGRRFLDCDLNRSWTPEKIASIRAQADPSKLSAEEREQLELLQALETTLAEARRPVFFVDLHTTSADGVPFAIVEDSMDNRRFAFRFPIPVILGIEEEISGALMDYLTDLGHITITFEGGQHDSPLSIDHHEALLWLAFEATGLITRQDFPELEGFERKVREICSNTPGAFEVRHRHAIRSDERFCMKAGLCNFDPVSKHQVIASNQWGVIKAPLAGRIIMPLYQELGEDGFFLGREFSLFWLRLSALLRRLRLGRLSHWLPGVHRHPEREGCLLVDPGIARWFEVEIFHLLGFRRHPPEGKYLVFSPRNHGR